MMRTMFWNSRSYLMTNVLRSCVRIYSSCATKSGPKRPELKTTSKSIIMLLSSALNNEICLCCFRKKLANMSKVLPVVKEDLSRQKFSFKKLKAVAAQHSSQLQSELRVTCSAIATAINTFAQNLPCDGSCVQIRQQFKCKHQIFSVWNVSCCFMTVWLFQRWKRSMHDWKLRSKSWLVAWQRLKWISKRG